MGRWTRCLPVVFAASAACAASPNLDAGRDIVNSIKLPEFSTTIGVIKTCTGPGEVSGTIQQRCDLRSDLSPREVSERVRSDFERRGWTVVEDTRGDEILSMERPCPAGRCLVVVDDFGQGNYSIWVFAGE